MIPGDADGCTWNFIKACYHAEEEKLKTKYLLLSHHGSMQDGATSEDMLALFQPEACFISAGRYEKYHHPRREVIDMVTKEPPHNRLRNFTKSYPISYYVQEEGDKKPLRKRKNYKKMISSTLDEGILTFYLNKPRLSVDITRNRGNKISTEDEVGDMSFEKGEKHIDFKDTKTKELKIFIIELKKDIKKLQADAKKKKPEQKIIFFTKHSTNHNLILPEDGENVDVDAVNAVFYLIDLNEKAIYKLIKEL